MKSALLVFATVLVGCTRDPSPIIARVERGNLVFDVQSTGGARDCITRVAVFAEDSGYLAMPETGDDRDSVEAGDYWRAVGEGKDLCLGRLPFRYGGAVDGQTVVKPKPLRIGAVYTVALSEGPSEYRMGRFRITPDRRVENLPRLEQPVDTTD